jgi:hypothetical protein
MVGHCLSGAGVWKRSHSIAIVSRIYQAMILDLNPEILRLMMRLNTTTSIRKS